jgi:ligand-binding sensor domain-containing protein
MKRRIRLIILFLFFVSYDSVAINRVYTVEDGLASDIIYCIIQDDKGFTWFGTNNGVSQFDGYTFKNYSIDDGLTDNEVFKIFQDSQGRVWFLTYNGKLCYYFEGKIYNGENMPFLNTLLVSSFFTHAIEDSNHDIYFLKQYSKQLYKLSGETFSKIEIENSFQFNSLFLKNKTVCIVSISVLDNGVKKYSLFDISSKPIFMDSFESPLVYSQFNYIGNKFVAVNRGNTGIEKLSINHGIDFNIKNSIVIDSVESSTISFLNSSGHFSNSYYVATSNGLYIYDSNLVFKQKILEKISVNTCLVDFENGVWCGTKGNGLHYYSETSASQIVHIDNGAYAIYENSFNKSEIWVSSIGDYYSYNLITNQLKKYSLPEFINRKDLITDIAFIDKNILLLGNGHGVVYFNRGVQKITPDKAGIKKIVVNNDSIYYARSNGIIVQHISNLFKKCTYIDSSYKQIYNYRTNTLYKLIVGFKRIWLGTADGLFYLNHKKAVKFSEKINTRITKIIESPKGSLTICSDLGGVYIIINDSIIHITSQSGLISNRVNGIRYDKNGALWVATAKGISKVIIENPIKVKNYSTANGLPDIVINDIYSLNDSVVLLATSSGLYSYNHSKEMIVSKPYTNVLLLKVNSKLVAKESLCDLEYYENNIEIGFTGISYASNKNIEYWYALKTNVDKEKWVKLNAPFLNFINLSPSNYLLLLKSKNIQGVWSDIIEIPISINKPFYQKWWFYLAVFIVFISSIISILILSRNKNKKEQAIAKMISETRQKALRAQLNPHFIFNALNSIQYLFLSNEEDLAQEYLAKFSSILRNTLNYSDKTYTSLADELENVKLYMELEQIRKKNFFKFHISIDDEIDSSEIVVPSMFLQPIVENAIWHGIQPLKTEGEIRIEIINVDSSYFEINIIDNGIGYSKSKKSDIKQHKHKSKGSELISDRLKTLNFIKGEKAEFNIIDLEQGTCVKFKLPKRYNNV